MSKPATRRTITIGGTTHEVSVVTQLNIEKRCLYIDEMPDGSLRLNYSRALVPDVALLESVRVGPADAGAIKRVAAPPPAEIIAALRQYLVDAEEWIDDSENEAPQSADHERAQLEEVWAAALNANRQLARYLEDEL